MLDKPNHLNKASLSLQFNGCSFCFNEMLSVSWHRNEKVAARIGPHLYSMKSTEFHKMNGNGAERADSVEGGQSRI